MAVFAVCSACSTRRDNCTDINGHKKFVRWTADVHFSRGNERLRKTFRVKELADIQERQWITDYERGVLLPNQKVISKTFGEVADEWALIVVGQNRIKNYEKTDKYRVNMFKNLFGQRPISGLTLKDGNDWLNNSMAEGKAINTVNRSLKPLNWIMNHAVKMGYIKENPFKEIKNIKGGNVHDRWMDQNEVQRLLEAAASLEDLDLCDFIRIGVNTGFRKGNLERLSIKDIESSVIWARQTKSGKPYWIPISSDALPVLQRLCKERPTGPLLNTTNVDRRFRFAVKKAGFYVKNGDMQNVTIHTLRHTFAALYLKRGGDLYKLSKLLGHSSIAITEKNYAHLCPKEMDAQAALIGTNLLIKETSNVHH